MYFMRAIIALWCAVLSFSVSFGQNNYANMPENEFLNSNAFNSAILLQNVDVDLIEIGVFHLTNQTREKYKLKPLVYNQQLSNAAYLHSTEMTEKNFFDHTNKYNKKLATLDKRIDYVGYINYVEIAENIQYTYIEIGKATTYKALCQEIVKNFIKSSEHKKIMLDKNLKEMGCGVSFTKKVKDGYWYFNITEDFGSKF